MLRLARILVKGTICLFAVYGLLRCGEERLENERSDRDLDIDLDNGKGQDQ